MQRSTKIILVVSAALLISEIGLVWTNWQADGRRTQRTVNERGAVLREGFSIAKATTELQLAAIANFIADVDDVRRRMDKGRKALESGDERQAETWRQELQQIVGQRWHNLQFRFLLRQLGFYLPDGTAFLRSDVPYRHGDNATSQSALLRTAATRRHVVTGFEIGRWSTGLRAVAPVFDAAADGQHSFLGMVEVGTSFDPMLVPICPTAECGIAVLLNRASLAAMPAGVRDAQFTPDRIAGPWLMEASSNPALTRRFAADIAMLAEGGSETRLIAVDGKRWYGVTSFPLMDFAGTTTGGDAHPPVGMVTVWQDATDLVAAVRDDLIENVLFATLAFLLVEAFLILSVRLATRRLEREIASATAESRALLDKVTVMAERDPLTDLYNRRTFDRRMADAIAMATRTGLPLSLAMIDLDHFKSINDTYGHGAGDQVIARIAQLLHELVRTTDVACRWGGEEFVLALPATSDRQALVLLERLRQRLDEANAAATEEDATPVFTFSAGIAQWQPGDDLDSLLKRSDRALYRAKRNGRDRIEVMDAAEVVV